MSLISVSYSLISASKPIVLRTCVGYSQRIGYQPSMSQLDAAVARYNKLLETGPCSDLAWAEALHARMERLQPDFGVKTYRFAHLCGILTENRLSTKHVPVGRRCRKI